MEKPCRIGVLAVQGNFREHAAMLRALGAEAVEVRLPEELGGLDGLVIPGGESTAIARLMRLYGLEEALRRFTGPVFGTCAGMILLDRNHLDLVDVEVRLSHPDASELRIALRSPAGTEVVLWDHGLPLADLAGTFDATLAPAGAHPVADVGHRHQLRHARGGPRGRLHSKLCSLPG